MEIAVSRVGDMQEIAVVKVSGVVDSETVELFGETVEGVFKENCYNIILDIDGLRDNLFHSQRVYHFHIKTTSSPKHMAGLLPRCFR